MPSSLFDCPVFESFATQRPIATASQLVLRRLLDPDAIDRLFRDNAELQYEQTLLFSSLTQLMTTVVLGKYKSVNAAYRKMFDRLDVSVTSIYNKLQRIEPQTSQALVRHAYREAVAVCREIGGVPRHDVPGYATRILDGNHLGKTEHRLKETRNLVAGPLPGKSLVVFDPRHDAVCDFFPIEDGHAQELSALDEVIETLQRGQLWIADRNFCVLRFMYRIAQVGGAFVIRQHGKLKGTVCGKLRRIGKSETAEVFENQLILPDHNGGSLTVRRVVVKLSKPTRDGDSEIVLLTSFASDEADAVKVSELYRDRWKVETAFMHMTVSLNCEVDTLCYPPAALFCFSLALVSYNAISIIKSLVAAQCGRDEMKMLSHYYVACEISQATEGLLIAIPEHKWNLVPKLKLDEFTRRLLDVADSIDMRRYRKSVRGPKKKPPKKIGNKRTVHVSTKRILDKRKKTTS